LIGRTLSHYHVTAALGTGGMGAVYRATDTKLEREVAIKVLPAAFAEDRERLARFEREAKLLASLNHPNIAHVYGFEIAKFEDGSTAHFLAMELVEGEDLSERLKRGPIPVEETLAIAKQITRDRRAPISTPSHRRESSSIWRSRTGPRPAGVSPRCSPGSTPRSTDSPCAIETSPIST
jgi:serine/threonine protein kinase